MMMMKLLQAPIEPTLILFEKYGVSLTILVIVLFFCGFLVRFILKRVKTQDKRIDTLIKTISHDNSEDIDQKLSTHAKNSDKVHQLIYYMLNDFGADRISIFEFHNGGKTYNGVDFKKCSNTYEVTGLGIDGKFKDYQNIPISINVLWYKLLNDNNMISIDNINKLEQKTDSGLPCYFEGEDKTIFNLLKYDNVKSYYSRLILDYDNKPLGFITLTFYKEFTTLTSDQLKVLNDATFSIGSLINIKSDQ